MAGLGRFWEAIEDFHDQFSDAIDPTKELPGEMEVLQGIVKHHPGNLAAEDRLKELEKRHDNLGIN